jgi:hypothetical protein
VARRLLSARRAAGEDDIGGLLRGVDLPALEKLDRQEGDLFEGVDRGRIDAQVADILIIRSAMLRLKTEGIQCRRPEIVRAFQVENGFYLFFVFYFYLFLYKPLRG